DRLVARPLERHDQLRRLVEPAPAPGVELRLAVGGQVELRLLAVEAEGEPRLFLAAPVASGFRALQAGREVVGDPAVGAAEQADAAGAGLFGEFAAGGGFQVLAGVDAALRELPV